MYNLNNRAKELFASDIGNSFYLRILSTMEKYNMTDKIQAGTLLGFSGGADSVLLLLFLLEYRRRTGNNFNILCVHVNHKIRGDEAERDENFSKSLINSSSAEFMAVSVDIPLLAKSENIGVEEAARNARYSIFRDIISSREDLSCIAVAHNATDNIETVIFNMLRGTGLSGICGIKPVRGEIVRPMLSIAKSDILDLLQSFDISYVTDSTNLSSEYSRNYIRNEILPLLKKITPNPERTVTRMSENLLQDLEYLNTEAVKISQEYEKQGYIEADVLASLPPAIFARVIATLAYRANGIFPEEKHITAISQLINRNNFEFSLPGKYNFSSQRGKCKFIEKTKENECKSLIFPLTFGENKISGTNLTVYIGEVKDSSINVYNFSIKASIASAIINNGIFLRLKKDGDSYKYSGITHKLKKVFNDRNIPPREREYIPLIADSEGILWVPGLPVRDNSCEKDVEKNTSVTFCYDRETEEKITMYTALNRV